MTGTQKFNAIASGVGQIGGLIGYRNRKTGGAISGAAGGAMAGMALGGPIGAVAGGILGGVAGIFGGSRQEKEERRQREEAFKQMSDAIEAQYGSFEHAEAAALKYGVSVRWALDHKDADSLNKALVELEKRMKATEQAAAGMAMVIDNLQYRDPNISQEEFDKLTLEEQKKHLRNTFEDPAVAGAIAGQFSTTFWETWRRMGVAGLDKMRPAWEKMHQQLLDLGLDPTKLGLGAIGDLMSRTNDPKTRALLGVSQGQSELLRGAMDAGYMTAGMVEQSTTVARATLDEMLKQGMSAEQVGSLMADQLVALNRAYAAQGMEMPEDLKAAMEAAGLTIVQTEAEKHTKLLEEIRDGIMGTREYASGGIVSGRQLAWVGEEGPEAIIPLRGRNAGGLGGTYNQTVVFNANPRQSRADQRRQFQQTTRDFVRAQRTDPYAREMNRRSVVGGLR